MLRHCINYSGNFQDDTRIDLEFAMSSGQLYFNFNTPYHGVSSFDYLFAIYGVAYVQLAHSRKGDWKGVFITHLIIIIKSEVSVFPIVVIFFRGCVSEMVVLPYSVIDLKYIPGTPGPCLTLLMSSICKRSDTLWPVGGIRLFANYTISFSSLCRLIRSHWTTKLLVRQMQPCVCKIETVVSIIFIWYMGLCVPYPISIIKSEVWIINHCLWLGHETMVRPVFLTMFLCFIHVCIVEPVALRNLVRDEPTTLFIQVAAVVHNFTNVFDIITHHFLYCVVLQVGSLLYYIRIIAVMNCFMS